MRDLLHPDTPDQGVMRLHSDDRLLVTEIFGPTFQGEGPSAGHLAAFLRVSRCQLQCRWCDTPYTWDPTRYDLRAESRRMSQAQVWHAVKAIQAGLVVITGGEPLLQQHRLVWLADMCRANGRRVEIETNGAVIPSPGILGASHQFNVSLKLGNSGMPAHARLRPDAIKAFASSRKAVWKFVVTASADLDEIADLQQRHGLDPVWVMPEGTTSEQILRRLRDIADPVLAHGWNLTSRLHILLWEDARGR